MRIARFSVSQPVLVNALVVLLLLGGAYCYWTADQEVMPEVPLKIATITTAYPGASPEDVEETVTVPIEDRIESVQDIDFFHSVSIQGRSVIVVQFRDYVEDIGDKVRKLQRQVDLASAELPERAEEPVVQEQEYTIPVVSVAASGPVSRERLKREIEQLRESIQRIEGVGGVTKLGVSDREIQVKLDLRRLDGYGMDLLDVRDALRAASENVPGGTMKTGRGEGLISVRGEISSIPELRQTVVRRNPDGSLVRLEEVAESVRYGYEDRSFLARVNGSRAAMLIVSKTSSGDAIEIVNRLRDHIEQRRASIDGPLKLSLWNDNSKYVRTRLETMNQSLVWGLALVLVGLLLLLNWRVALMTTLGIPVSLAFAMIVHTWMGGTLNMITLFSFIVVLGVIVDDGIIIAENCFRHIEEGKHPIRAAIDGTNEVFWPVVLAVATNIAAFLPLLLIEGRIGKFMKWIPMIAIFAFLGSLIEAFLVLPSHVADFVRPSGSSQRRSLLNGAVIVYRYVLKQCLRWRYLVVPLFVLGSAGTIYFAFTRMNIVFFNNQYLDYARVSIRADRTAGLDETESVVGALEEKIRSGLPNGSIQSVVSVIGRSSGRGGSFRTRSNLASIKVDFTPSFSRSNGSEAIFGMIRDAVEGVGGLQRLRVRGMKGGPPESKDIQVEISGPTLSASREKAQRAVEILREQPGTRNVSTNYEPGKQRLIVRPDRKRASYYGVDTRRIAATVRGLHEGSEAYEVRRDDELVDVVVRGAPGQQFDPARLRRMTVHTSLGTVLPMDYLIDTEWVAGPAARTRYNGRPTVTVRGDVDEDLTSVRDVLAPLKRAFRDLASGGAPFNVRYEGGNEDINQMVDSMTRAGVLALITIFLLMGMLFRNVGHPVVILFTVPFSLIGIIYGMIISNLPLGFMALMGTVAVAGVVVNDSMILVNFVNNARMDDRGVNYGLLKAGSIRFRPVMLTTITTMAGLMPLALGVSGQETILIPMALAIIWGMLFATVLTLLVIPALYKITDEFYDLIGFDPLHHHRKMKDVENG